MSLGGSLLLVTDGDGVTRLWLLCLVRCVWAAARSPRLGPWT